MKLSYYFALALLSTTYLRSMDSHSDLMDCNNNAMVNSPHNCALIFLSSEDLEGKEIVRSIPNDHFAMCFYAQLKYGQYALVTISPNAYLITQDGEYGCYDEKDPNAIFINNFFELSTIGAIYAYSHILIASNLNVNYCKKTENFFSEQQHPSAFYSYDLKSIESAQKHIGVKLYKDEYRSFCAITNDKGELSYAQSFQENDTEDVAQVILSLDKQYSQLSVSHK